MKPDELPHNYQVEQRLLGSVLIDDQGKSLKCILEAGVTRNDFYSVNNRTIFQHILQLSSLERAIDLVTVSDSLSRPVNWRRLAAQPILQASSTGSQSERLPASGNTAASS